MNRPTETQDKPAITAEKYDDFIDAISLFYIKGNRSGRLKFQKDWPGVAPHILGDELMGLDMNGSEDSAHVTTLENEAEERRIKILDIVENCIENSVKDGVFQKDYVAQVIHKVGYDIAILIYSQDVLDRLS